MSINRYYLSIYLSSLHCSILTLNKIEINIYRMFSYSIELLFPNFYSSNLLETTPYSFY